MKLYNHKIRGKVGDALPVALRHYIATIYWKISIFVQWKEGIYSCFRNNEKR